MTSAWQQSIAQSLEELIAPDFKEIQKSEVQMRKSKNCV